MREGHHSAHCPKCKQDVGIFIELKVSGYISDEFYMPAYKKDGALQKWECLAYPEIEAEEPKLDDPATCDECEWIGTVVDFIKPEIRVEKMSW